MKNPFSILKSRDNILLTKVHIVKAMVFPVVTFRCESWTVKKAKHHRIDTFKLQCWRTLLEAPWTTRRWKQLILKGIYSEYSLEGWCRSWSSNTLATWCEELIHWKRPWRADSLEKIGGKRRKGQWRMSWLDSITDSMDMNLSKFWEMVEDRGTRSATVHGVIKSETRLIDWTTTLFSMVLHPWFSQLLYAWEFTKNKTKWLTAQSFL